MKLGNGIREISKLEELVHFYVGVFDSIDAGAIFFRPLTLNGGQGCFKLDREKFPEQLEAEFRNLMDGDYIQTEVIAQHPEICPSS